jgi:hypothetical protein
MCNLRLTQKGYVRMSDSKSGECTIPMEVYDMHVTLTATQSYFLDDAKRILTSEQLLSRIFMGNEVHIQDEK